MGKLLAGAAVVTEAGEAPSPGRALVREAVGKWGFGVAAPLVLGRVVAGRTWEPTVYDALILLPVLLLQAVHYLIAKRAWYDRLAGTHVERAVWARRHRMTGFAALSAAAALGAGAVAAELVVRGRVPCRLALFHGARSTGPYVDFLEGGRLGPVDYVLGLFSRHDVVVICERLHPESSQWDFIHQVVSDPRFIDRVGHVFTEFGQARMQDDLDRFLAADGLSRQEVHERVVHLMRHPPVWPVWINTNLYTYLTRLYALNQSLPPERRIRHHFTGASVDWADLTREGYLAHRRSLADRDAQMAQRIIEAMDRLKGAAPRPAKCLVVMNYRHAFDLTGRAPAAEPFNTFEYLKDAFDDRAANVLLHTWRPVTAPWSSRVLLDAPIARGVWDAAFERTGHRPVGFDLDGSPFGDDSFDLFPFIPEVGQRLRYRDVFTGYVFDRPRHEQYTQLGVSGYFAGFEKEALRRAAFIGGGYRRIIASLIEKEQRGDVARPRRVVPPVSTVDLFLLGFAGAGWLIGAGLLAAGRPPRSPKLHASLR